MGRYDTLKQTINICKREGIQWKKCPVWKNVDMDRIKRDKVYRDEVASYIMFWTGRNDLFPYKGGTTPEHLAAHDGEWGSMQEGKLNEIGETPAGQWMLGRLAGRQRNREIGQGDRKSPISYKSGKIKNTTVDAYDYAEKDGFGGDYDSHEAFGRGYDTENGEWANDYDSNGNYDHSQHLDNERQNAENMGYGYAMKAMINAQQRKNPQKVKLSESQLRTIVAESVKKVLNERTLNMKTIGIVSGLMEIKKMSQFLINKYEAIDDSSDGIEAIYNTVHDCVMQLYQVTEQFGY